MKNIRIGGTDGPTSVFILKKNAKLTSSSHTFDEVMNYIVNVHGFREAYSNAEEVLEEYREMRTSFLIRHAPELLGEYAENPTLKSTDEEAVRKFLEQSRQRIQKAMEISITKFDIDFYKYTKIYFDIVECQKRT